MSCSLSIFSKVGTSASITKNPEIETAKINILFYNLPMGELGESVQKQIDDAKKDAQGIWKTIGALNNLVQLSKRICQALNTIFTTVASLYVLTQIIK